MPCSRPVGAGLFQEENQAGCMVNAVILRHQFSGAPGFVIKGEVFLGLFLAIDVDDELASGGKGILERATDSFELGIISL